MLNDPLPWQQPTRVSVKQVEQEGADFMATMAMHTQVTGG